METPSAEAFIDQQLAFNNDIVKASTGMAKGLTLQADMNKAVAEQIINQESILKTHRQLITVLTIVSILNSVGIILWMLA
jgi:hypothetical protein